MASPDTFDGDMYDEHLGPLPQWYLDNRQRVQSSSAAPMANLYRDQVYPIPEPHRWVDRSGAPFFPEGHLVRVFVYQPLTNPPPYGDMQSDESPRDAWGDGHMVFSGVSGDVAATSPFTTLWDYNCPSTGGGFPWGHISIRSMLMKFRRRWSDIVYFIGCALDQYVWYVDNISV